MKAAYVQLLIAALAARLSLAETTTMGPVGFTWPTARTWSSDDDRGAPCGSPDGPGDRTSFPLTHGAVAIQMNEDAYKINVGISYNSDPGVNADFETLVAYSNFPSLGAGNECFSVPNPRSSVLTGQNATLQLSYVVTDDGTNNTYYACADIVYIALTEFTEAVSCYNYSEATGVTTTDSDIAPPVSTSTSSSGSKKHLSAGAIAGIVVGVAVAAMLVAGFIFFKVYGKMKRNAEIRHSHRRMREWKRLSDASKLRENV